MRDVIEPALPDRSSFGEPDEDHERRVEDRQGEDQQRRGDSDGYPARLARTRHQGGRADDEAEQVGSRVTHE